MVGWKRVMLAGLAGCIAAGLIAGCGGKPAGQDGKLKVGVVQIVQHPALDEANKGFVDALTGSAIKDRLEIDQQNAQGDQSNLQSIANRFVSGKYSLIAAISTPAAQSMANATDKIPIVGTAIADYETAKLMKSEKAPEANVTGTHDRGPLAKQVALMQEIQPDIKNIGVIYNSSEVNSVIQVKRLREMVEPMGLHVVELTVNSVNDVQQVAEGFLGGQVDAIFVPTDNVIASSIPTLMQVAEREKIPVYGAEAGHVKSGVFASESISFYDIGHRAGEMAAEILMGNKQVKDFPVEGAAQSKLYINRGEMEKLGIRVPQAVLDRAEII
ncbi:MAG: ABC transporter substrate-binding protein [Dialister sp.]|nr:ABC transporter substrate-binding protein [Dialister sp.]